MTRQKTGTALAVVMALALGFVLGMLAAPVDAADRTRERNAAILDVVAGDYIGSEVVPLAPGEVDALADVYATEERTGEPCWSLTARLLATRDFTPTMRPCLGEEDSAAVAVILSH